MTDEPPRDRDDVEPDDGYEMGEAFPVIDFDVARGMHPLTLMPVVAVELSVLDDEGEIETDRYALSVGQAEELAARLRRAAEEARRGGLEP